MNKAEELKQKLIDAYVFGLNSNALSNKNFKKTLDEYAAEVSRERAIQYKDWILKHYGYSDRPFVVPDSSYEDFDFEFPFKEQEEL